MVVVVVMVVVVMIHVVVVGALPPRFFEFMAALPRLFAVLAVPLHRVTQLIFRLVNSSFTPVVSISVIGPCLEG